jgi:hypothetical protein
MKRYSVALSVVVVLVIAAYLVLQRPGEWGSSGRVGDMLVRYDSAAVDKLQITSRSGNIVLERQGDKWYIVEPIRYRAHESHVGEAVGRGRSLELTSLVSTNPEKQGLFQVDSTGTQVRIFERGVETAVFYIGKLNDTFSETFVRREGSDQVFLARGQLETVFAKEMKDWRNSLIFKTEQSAITHVKFAYGDTTYSLVFEDSLWRVNGETATDHLVRSFLVSLSNFESDDFIDTPPRPLPRLTATLEVAGTTLRFYFNKDTSKYFVQSSESPQWYEVQNWRASQLLKRKKDFTVTAG